MNFLKTTLCVPRRLVADTIYILLSSISLLEPERVLIEVIYEFTPTLVEKPILNVTELPTSSVTV